jgi:hypothetical protein
MDKKPSFTQQETMNSIKTILGDQNSARAGRMRAAIEVKRGLWESMGHKVIIPSNLDVDTIRLKCSKCPAVIVLRTIDDVIGEWDLSHMYLNCPIAPNKCPWCGSGSSVIGLGGWQLDNDRGVCVCHECGEEFSLIGETHPLSNHANHVFNLAARDPAKRVRILLIRRGDCAENVISKMRYYAQKGEIVIPCFRPENNI